MTTLLERLTGFKNSFQTGKNNIANVITTKGGGMVNASGSDRLTDYATKIESIEAKNSNAPNFGLYAYQATLSIPTVSNTSGFRQYLSVSLSDKIGTNWGIVCAHVVVDWANSASGSSIITTLSSYFPKSMVSVYHNPAYFLPLNSDFQCVSGVLTDMSQFRFEAYAPLPLYLASPSASTITDMISATITFSNDKKSMQYIDFKPPNGTYDHISTDCGAALTVLFAHPL